MDKYTWISSKVYFFEFLIGVLPLLLATNSNTFDNLVGSYTTNICRHSFTHPSLKEWNQTLTMM
jgi:hypothetical protein